MLTITDVTLSGINPKQTSKFLIREFYQKLLELGIHQIEISPEIHSLLKDECDLSRSLIIPNSELRILGSEDLFIKDYRQLFKKLLAIPFSFTFCAKNAGLFATALTIEWVMAGGKNIVCSFMGRGGYAPLEEVLLALKVNGFPLESIDTSLLKSLGNLWEELTGHQIPPYQPILGERVFEVESGIHIDGILKNNLNYEPFSPEMVGSERKFYIGKFSGKSALTLKLSELKLAEKIKEPDQILRLVKEKCLLKNKTLSDSDLILLFNEINDNINIAEVSV